MKPKCISCVNFTRWEQASGGTIPRCSCFDAVEDMIRTEMRLWHVSGNWASTCESNESPSVPSEEEPAYVCDEEDRDIEAAAQDYLNSHLVRLERTGPTYRSVTSIEEDVQWKFASCREFEEVPEEDAWDDPILLAHHVTDAPAHEFTSSPMSALVDAIRRIFPAAEEIIDEPLLPMLV